MRDDAGKWDVATHDNNILITENISVTQVQPDRQTMISGVSVLYQTPLTLVEWPGKIAKEQYALVLRRDRILEVNGPVREYGWDESLSCAVSNMSDGYSVLNISGPAALALLTRGGFIDTNDQSRSVARTLFGLPVLLYQHGMTDRFSLHIGSAHLQSFKSIILSCYANS